MKKIVFVALLLVSNVFTSVQAQQVEEPEFVGEVYLINPNDGITPLPKHLIQNKVNVPATLLLGVGRAKNNIVIEGCCSDVVVPNEKKIELVVKNVDNLSDPLAVVKIFKFKKNKKNRTAEVSSANLWGSVKKNTLDYVPFTAKKFGESSYLVTITNLKEGEYGISVVNPNALDQKETVISTFAVK